MKNLHFEPNFVILDRGYPMKNLHFEPNLVILNSIMYPIKNFHFLVQFWVQNHHSKHEIDSPHDCKSLWFFDIFFIIFQKNHISAPWFQNFFDDTCPDYISILKCLKILQLIISYFLITCRWKIAFFEPFFSIFENKKNENCPYYRSKVSFFFSFSPKNF